MQKTQMLEKLLLKTYTSVNKPASERQVDKNHKRSQINNVQQSWRPFMFHHDVVIHQYVIRILS